MGDCYELSSDATERDAILPWLLGPLLPEQSVSWFIGERVPEAVGISALVGMRGPGFQF